MMDDSMGNVFLFEVGEVKLNAIGKAFCDTIPNAEDMIFSALRFHLLGTDYSVVGPESCGMTDDEIVMLGADVAAEHHWTATGDWSRLPNWTQLDLAYVGGMPVIATEWPLPMGGRLMIQTVVAERCTYLDVYPPDGVRGDGDGDV